MPLDLTPEVLIETVRRALDRDAHDALDVINGLTEQAQEIDQASREDVTRLIQDRLSDVERPVGAAGLWSEPLAALMDVDR